MTTEVKRTDNKVEVKVIGRLDTLASTDFNTVIEPFLKEDSIEMTIECSQMEYIASSGLRSLLALYKALTSHSGSMTMVGVQPVIMQVLNMTGFSNFLNIK